MTNIESLITLARHYCINNHNFWVEKYEHERSGKMYSDSDYNIFPTPVQLRSAIKVEQVEG